MNKIATWLIGAALLCASGLVCGEEFTAKVIAVLDGDTVLIRRASGLLKIRLAEIDAPEVGYAGMGGQLPNSQKAQTFGEISKRSLSDMVMGKRINFVSETTDQYGRMVAHLSINGLDVNAEQVRRGMAWEYSNFHSNKALIALQDEARQAGRGLWVQSNPPPPWEWRKLHPSTKTAVIATSATTGHAATPGASCGSKKHCSEMTSCEEARFYLTQCGIKALDGDGDGTPCENLCAPQNKIEILRQ